MLAQGDVAGLCRALQDQNPLIRRRAAQALGELRQPVGVSHLAHALREDKDQYVLRWSIEALREIGDEAAVDALTTAVFGSNRQLVALAVQALAAIPTPQAASAIRLRDILSRADMDALASIEEDASQALKIVLASDQYASWPSGKQKQVLRVAARFGIKLSSHYARELMEMGVFVSGVHTIGDLIGGLRHRSPVVRAAAAEKMGSTGHGWMRFVLYNRFRQEVRPGGDRSVAVAVARALGQLGDKRPVTYYKQQLYGADSLLAADAARILSGMGSPEAVRTLFEFVVNPPPAPAYRNVPQALTALENIGPEAVDVLRPLMEHKNRKVRLALVGIIIRSRHPEMALLLGQMGHDVDPDVQHAAIDGLAGLNSPAAAEVIYKLSEQVPRDWVIRALAAITCSESLQYIRNLDSSVTTLHGTVVEDDGQPLARAGIQIVREHYFGEQSGWGWLAVSARAETNLAGEFALAVLTEVSDAATSMKVVIPPVGDGKDGETFMANLSLAYGQGIAVKARIDRFFSRLVITREGARG
jgi:HEAT repeat protein